MFAEFIYDYFLSQMNFTHQNIDEWWAKIETYENEHVLLLLFCPFRIAPRSRVSLESGHIVARASKTSLMMNRNRNIQETMCNEYVYFGLARCSLNHRKIELCVVSVLTLEDELYSLIVFKPFIWENVV